MDIESDHAPTETVMLEVTSPDSRQEAVAHSSTSEEKRDEDIIPATKKDLQHVKDGATYIIFSQLGKV